MNLRAPTEADLPDVLALMHAFDSAEEREIHAPLEEWAAGGWEPYPRTYEEYAKDTFHPAGMRVLYEVVVYEKVLRDG